MDLLLVLREKERKKRVVQEAKTGMSRGGKGKADKAGETLFVCVPGWEAIEDGQQKVFVHTNTVGKQGTGLWIWTRYQFPIFPVAKTAPWKGPPWPLGTLTCELLP